jgi:hypothetical protein
MAIRNGDGASGSLGSIIHYYRNGKYCMRAKPAHVENPKTEGQVHHRNKIKLAGRLIRSLKKFINIGYQDTDFDMPMNEIRKHLIQNCFDKTTEGTVLDYSRVKIARGELMKPEETTLTIDAGSAHITWNNDVKGHYSNNDDKVMIALFIDEGDDGQSVLLSNVATRRDGACNIPLPAHTAPMHIWMFYYNPDLIYTESKKKVSDSAYLSTPAL